MSGVAVRQLGKYEIRATIGRGAVGIVYEAWDPVMARTVAIKTLPLIDMDDEGKEQYARFKQEAQAAARLHHPNIVSAFDYGETESSAYIVMEYLAGPSLKTLLANRQPRALPEVARIMHGLLLGLQHSHQRGVVHRDIKPGNVVFSADGEVKITDFGVAHLESSGMTRAGAVIGTPAYMAPEQVLSEAVDARTDVYAAGVVCYELLTGVRPFEGSTSSIMHKIVHLPPPQPSELTRTISPPIDAIIARAIAKNPADRYQTAAEFDNALRACLEQAAQPAVSAPAGLADDLTLTPNRAPPAVASTPRVAPASRSPWLIPIVAAAVVVAGAIGWLLLPGAPPQTAQQSAANSQQTVAPSPASPTSPPDVRPPAATTVAPKPPPPATPAVQPASKPADPILQQIGAIVGSAPCSFIAADAAASGPIGLRGVSGLGETSELEIQATLQRAIQMALPAAAVSWHMRRVDGPYCPVLDALRSVGDGAGRSAVALSLPAERSRLADGDAVRVSVNISSAPARLTLDLFASDGTVHHLHSGPADASHTYPAAAWKAGEPHGDQLITALVTSNAVFTRNRPEREPAAAYLRDLEAALAPVRGHDDRLAAGVLAIDVVAR